MKYVKDETSITCEEKKSKFIAHIFSFEYFDEVMKRLKEEHPKARHHVYAYRYLNQFDQVVENCSDDGEPKGTSGRPSLNVLAGHSLINTGVIIVRYFGGVKLGTGGLVRAYSDAVNEVISKVILLEYEKLEIRNLVIPYNELSKVEYLCEQCTVSIKNKLFTNDVELVLESTKEKLDALSSRLPLNIDFI